MVELFEKTATILNEFYSTIKINKDFVENASQHQIDKKNLAAFFDHTLLKNDVSDEQIADHCVEAIENNCKAVCIHPAYVDYAKKILDRYKSRTKLCAVADFPLGAGLSANKAYEIKKLTDLGVDEIDFVAPIYLIKNKKWSAVAKEFETIRKASNLCLKVILETGLLNDEEKISVSLLAIDANLDFLKTSTGFVSGGASIYDISLLKSVAKNLIKIKASGGIKNLNFAKQLIAAGADRLGASATVKILNEF